MNTRRNWISPRTVALGLGAMLVAPFSLAQTSAARAAANSGGEVIDAKTLAALATLSTEDLPARRAVAEDAKDLFGPFGRDDGTDTGPVRELRDLLRIETDDWTVSLILRELDETRAPPLESVFREALVHPSVDVRRRAWRHFAGQDAPDLLPELEASWSSEMSSWARADLIAALARQRAGSCAPAIRALAGVDDLRVSEAAICALPRTGDEGAIPVLRRIALGGRIPEQLSALQALSSWPDSEEAADAVLEASRSSEVQVRAAAIAILAGFRVDAARRLVIDLARAPGDGSDRLRAVKALGSIPGPDSIETLIEILGETVSVNPGWLRFRALQSLELLHDPASLPLLVQVADRMRNDDWMAPRVRELIETLSTGAGTGDQHAVDSIPCGQHKLGLGGSEAAIVSPPPSLATIRCWRSPGIAGPAAERPRIPTGTPVWVQDHFAAPAESWEEVAGWVRSCWVRSAEIAPAVPPTDDGPLQCLEQPRNRRRIEEDVPASDLASTAADRLLESGDLIVIEPGGEVAGVSLAVDPSDDAEPGRLFASYRGGRDGLDGLIERAASRLQRSRPDERFLRLIIKRAAEAREAGRSFSEDIIEDLPPPAGDGR